MSLDKARTQEQELTDVRQLVDHFRAAERPVVEHQVGLEHEKLLFVAGTAAPVPYQAPAGSNAGVGAVLEALSRQGYAPFREAPELPIIALERGQLTVSLEPGGQLELSGTAFRTAREAHAENVAHARDVLAVAGQLGVRVVALGYRPFGAVASMPWMPKTRYQVMRDTLGRRGRLALDMMLMTATGQVSLDWADEEDCARKVSVVARTAPLMVALYANSPLVNGATSGYASFRSRVWSEVDPARCGYIRQTIEGGFDYRAYVEWALDAPMLFLRRGGQYLTPKLTFRQLLANGFEGKPATTGDWTDHLSTLFPEVRLKKVLEVRGADGVGLPLTGALPALWRGILYDRTALAEAEALLPRLKLEEHQELHEVARRDGLRGRYRKLELAPLARDLVEIARRGLKRLEPTGAGPDSDDAALLDPLAEVAASGRSPADTVQAAWERTRDPEAVLRLGELRL